MSYEDLKNKVDSMSRIEMCRHVGFDEPGSVFF